MWELSLCCFLTGPLCCHGHNLCWPIQFKILADLNYIWGLVMLADSLLWLDSPKQHLCAHSSWSQVRVVFHITYFFLFYMKNGTAYTHPCAGQQGLGQRGELGFDSSSPGHNGHYLTDVIFICIFINEKFCIFIKISWKFVHKGLIDNNPALVQIIAWHWIGDKPIMWTNVDPILWRIYVALRGDESNGPSVTITAVLYRAALF